MFEAFHDTDLRKIAQARAMCQLWYIGLTTSVGRRPKTGTALRCESPSGRLPHGTFATLTTASYGTMMVGREIQRDQAPDLTTCDFLARLLAAPGA